MAGSIVILPPDLKFSAAVPKTTFDIFNVHQYPVKYVIKTTSPEKYLINTTEGILSPQSAATIEVTHIDISVVNENVQDRFRVYFSQLKDRKYHPVGYRDVTAVLLPRIDESAQSGDAATRLSGSPASRSTSPRSRQPSGHSSASHHPPSEPVVAREADSNQQSHAMLYYLVPIFALVGALWLPTQGSIPDTPWYLELTVNTKVTIGFVLGILVTLFYMHVQRAGR